MALLIFFDFDEVLHRSDTEEPYPGIVDHIRDIHATGDYTFALATFNNYAHQTLAKWGILHCFSALRLRSNHPWHTQTNKWGKPAKYKEMFGTTLSKARQIQSMLGQEFRDREFVRIYFFDDLEANLKEVKEEFGGKIHTELVNPNTGFTLDQLPLFIKKTSLDQEGLIVEHLDFI